MTIPSLPTVALLATAALALAACDSVGGAGSVPVNPEGGFEPIGSPGPESEAARREAEENRN